MTWRSPKDLAVETGEAFRRLSGAIRRLAVTLTDGTRWQVIGKRDGTAGDEVVAVEVFGSIGIYARPPAGAKAEVIAVAPGGARALVAAGARDEATRQAAAGDLEPGETAVYTDKARILIKADGTVEIATLGGTALPLATKADIDALRSYISTHTHPSPAGGSTGTPSTPPPTAAGTAVLKAE